MNIYLTALGCRLNQAEIEALARDTAARGHVVVADPALADWAIVNTCTVTHVADKKSRQLIRQLSRANQHLQVAVIGCYGEMSPQQAANLTGVALVLPNRDKDAVLDHILPSADVPPVPLAPMHTRALVKIQEGCDNRCAYCIVSLARGPQRSRTPEHVLAEVRARLAEGYCEVVLTGVNIGAYGRDSASDGPLPAAAGWSLARLVRLLLAETDIPRLRLSSVEPWDIQPELLPLWADARLCRHLHLPLQSGCESTLRRMRRRHSAADYAEIVARARAHIPDLALSTDVMAGFPGESEAEFSDTLEFVERMAFARLHVFVYSRRPGTLAFDLPDQVPPPVARARRDALVALGRRQALAWHRGFVGREVEVLFEQPVHTPDGLCWSGLTDNYLRVLVQHSGDLHNRLARVRCVAGEEMGVRGELLAGADCAPASACDQGIAGVTQP